MEFCVNQFLAQEISLIFHLAFSTDCALCVSVCVMPCLSVCNIYLVVDFFEFLSFGGEF